MKQLGKCYICLYQAELYLQEPFHIFSRPFSSYSYSKLIFQMSKFTVCEMSTRNIYLIILIIVHLPKELQANTKNNSEPFQCGEEKNPLRVRKVTLRNCITLFLFSALLFFFFSSLNEPFSHGKLSKTAKNIISRTRKFL